MSQIAAAHPGKRLEVWFEDEARFGQQGTIARVWARTGSRPRVIRQTRYEWVYVLGAACPRTGQTAGLISPSLNTDVVNVYLRQLSAELAPDAHAVLIWDRAGYHTSGGLEVPSNITVVHLPPYSPELNPIENLWHYCRDHHWANRAYDDYDALRAAACETWQVVCLDKPTIQTVCHAPWLPRHYLI